MNEVVGLQKPYFVLVHGVCHGAWCWYKIRCLMETSGYKVTCLDLKSAGIDQSNPNTILTFDEYNAPLIDFLSNLPHDEKVILVGHSAGGLSLTDAIHRFPKKIHLAIYVAANMLKHGFSSDQDFKDGDPDVSEYGEIADLEYGMGLDEPPTSVIIKEEFQKRILYQMSPKEDSILASMLLRAGPVRAFKGARFEGGKDADIVPRVYIKTLHDHILRPVQQEAMIKRWQPCQVFELESDHSPFFSAPSLLFNVIVNAAATITCN
ncbi:PREDICTED: methylesterase 17-like [Populus euphratica]|uniref:Methylesterase 17-like n=1 Tax=Populus euphratica TaxID=75702 RepID=A0AAJ6V5W1_POPEU|nr:PREDICTED: methylesterase 17-like [Populus euphratica]